MIGDARILVKKDRGCSRAKKLGYMGKCVECPFKECLEDEVKKHQTNVKQCYKKVIVALAGGKSRSEIKAKYHISDKTLLYILDKRIKLLPREKECMELSSEGLSNGEIAELLNLSVGTVGLYKRGAINKTKALNIRGEL